MPKPRKRANWVTETVRTLNPAALWPQGQPSQVLKPLQNGATKPMPTAPLQQQTLAQRVQDAKQLPAEPLPLLQNQPLHLVEARQQQFEMPMPPPPALQQSAVPAKAAQPTCTSGPESSGKWRLTMLHVSDSSVDNSAVPSTRSRSNYGPTEASTSTQVSMYMAGAPSTAGGDLDKPIAVQEQVKSTREALCPGVKDKLGGTTLGSSDSCTTPSSVSSQARIGATAPPRDTQYTKSGPMNKVSGPSLILSCTAHAQPSPDSPSLKSGGTEMPCNSSAYRDDHVMETPAIQGTAATAALPVATAAPPISRRKALKQLIQRARKILAVDSNVDSLPRTAEDSQHAAETSSTIGQYPGGRPAVSNAAQHAPPPLTTPTAAAEQRKGVQAQHAHLPTMPAEHTSELISVSACVENRAPGTWLCSEAPPHEPGRKPADDTGAVHVVTCTQLEHVKSAESADVCNPTSATGEEAHRCTVPAGIWDQFVTRGKQQCKSSAPSAGLASEKLWTASQGTSDVWSSLQSTPSTSLLLATPDIACGGAARIVAPQGARSADEGQKASESQQPATLCTGLCKKEGTRTRSLIQNLLISRSWSDTGQAAHGNTSEHSMPSIQLKKDVVHQKVVHKTLPAGLPQVAPPAVSLAGSVLRGGALVAPLPAQEPQGHFAAFAEQDIELSPEMLLTSESDRRIETLPLRSTHILGETQVERPDRTIHDSGASMVCAIDEVNDRISPALTGAQATPQPAKELPVGHGNTDSVLETQELCKSTTSLHAEKGAALDTCVWPDYSQEREEERPEEQSDDRPEEHHSAGTRCSGSKPSAAGANRAFTRNFKQEPRHAMLDGQEPGSRANRENSFQFANGVVIGEDKQKTFQIPQELAKDCTKATEQLIEAGNIQCGLPAKHGHLGEVARGMQPATCTGALAAP